PAVTLRGPLRGPRSFPTRRSSDLVNPAGDAGGAVDAGPAAVGGDCRRRHAGRPGPDPGRADEQPVGSGGAGSVPPPAALPGPGGDRKSTRLNSSHGSISYAVFCVK